MNGLAPTFGAVLLIVMMISSLGRAAGVESRHRAGEGAAGRWVGATRRRRRPPNFTTSKPASWRECRQGARARAEPRGPGYGAARPSPAVPPDPLPSAGTRPEALPATQDPSPTLPRDPRPRTAGFPAGPAARPSENRPGGPGGGGPREARPGSKEAEGAAQPEFPTFSPGPDAAGADGTSRALPPPPASWSHAPGWGLRREAGPQAGRTRGADGAGRRRPAGGGGSGGAAAAGKN
uniref:translation initiation factor IF-2-like n=1 Tax=Callithrix jacchus TaxID=9483 RepID=UPI0023DD58EE|nr:translation initiation factor IF-2-like [Callithrix jacchus]